jgi:hypothetical protein
VRALAVRQGQRHRAIGGHARAGHVAGDQQALGELQGPA